MVPGVQWCERDGARYLRLDYTVASGVEQLLAMNEEMNEQVAAAGPQQRVLVVIDQRRQDGMTELSKAGLAAYRTVHQPLRTCFAVAGMPRAAAITLRAYNTLGARGRLAGFPDEAQALDWLLVH